MLPTGVKSLHQNEAWKFIQYMTNKPAQLGIGVKTGNIPALRAAATGPHYVDDSIRATFVQAIEFAHFRPNHPTYPRIDEILRGSLQNLVLKKEMSPKAALGDAARQAQQMVDEVNRLPGNQVKLTVA